MGYVIGRMFGMLGTRVGAGFVKIVEVFFDMFILHNCKVSIKFFKFLNFLVKRD